MANGSTALIKIHTRCTLQLKNGNPCGQIFTHYPIGAVPIVGQSQDQAVTDFVLKLMEHVKSYHGKTYESIFQTGKNFMGFLTLASYETQDTVLATVQAEFARYLRELSRIRVTDGAILSEVANLGFSMEDPQRVKVIESMKRLRDLLTGAPFEQAPQQAPQSAPQSQSAN